MSVSFGYMDDGVLVGPPTEVASALSIIQAESSKAGLSLNLDKCEIWSPNAIPSGVLPSTIPVADSGFLLLGAPIGSKEFINHHVEAKVAACSRIWHTLLAIGDPQTELLLLRSCLSFGKVSYLVRTTPLYNFDWSPYESGIRASVDQILGSILSDPAWRQATLPLSLGGLGLTSPGLISKPAFAGSLLFTSSLLAEHSVSVDSIPLQLSSLIQSLRADLLIPHSTDIPDKSSQKFFTKLAHQQVFNQLLANASASPRDACRLRSLSLPGATTFLQGVPNEHTGTRLVPTDFCLAVKWVLGCPVIPQPITCPACQDIFDVYGDHALSCKQGRDRISLHNSLRDVLASTASLGFGHSNVRVEVHAELAVGNHRPRDICITGWSHLNDTLFDITTTLPSQSTLLASSAHTTGHAAQIAHDTKLRKWEAHRDSSRETFIPLAVELWGGWHPSAHKAFSRLAARAAQATLL